MAIARTTMCNSLCTFFKSRVTNCLTERTTRQTYKTSLADMALKSAISTQNASTQAIMTFSSAFPQREHKQENKREPANESLCSMCHPPAVNLMHNNFQRTHARRKERTKNFRACLDADSFSWLPHDLLPSRVLLAWITYYIFQNRVAGKKALCCRPCITLTWILLNGSNWSIFKLLHVVSRLQISEIQHWNIFFQILHSSLVTYDR